VVQDVETCESIAGTPDLDEFRRSSIRSVQSTPLVPRSGQLLGMIKGRIQTLAKLHDLFVKSRWTGAELSRIVAQEGP
jgi:two-component sensor histidine kinase